MRCQTSVWIVALGLLTAAAPRAWAQQSGEGGQGEGERGPRFLLASAGAHARVPADIQRTPSLRHRISVSFDGVALKDALAEIGRQAGIQLFYSRDVVPVDANVRFRADNITVAGALSEVLLYAGVDVLLSADGRVALVRRMEVGAQPVGTISGRVTDAKTQTALAGAAVVVEGTSRSATAGNDGRYRIADVVPGTYTVRARSIGYTPGTVSVTVSADQEGTADFALEKSAQQLNEIVTTGTIVPTEVKALPTPVSVISESDIAQQRPRTVAELFRQAVPSAVSWDFGYAPYSTPFSVRGATSLQAGGAQMKVFLDGVETASSAASAVDPSSIERIEVIRGPQAAAIYGSDAIGGVVQIFTKRGDPNVTRPQVDAEAALGVLQTPYDGYKGVLRQAYNASVRGGGADVSYNFGGSYSHTDDYVPGARSAQSLPSVYGGMRFVRGIISLDLSGRYYTETIPNVTNPAFFNTGFFVFSKPFYQSQEFQNQTIGARLSIAPTTWWQHTITLGFDRATQDLVQTQPRLTTPGDTLLVLLNQSSTKSSVAYSTSIRGALGTGLSGSLTAGFDHYSLPVTQFFTSGALTTTGTIQTDPTQPISATRTITNNTGYFAQVQLAVRDALFLTGGIRAEQNSGFGDSLGTPVSPRVGLSYVQPLGGATFKVRGSWGRAIRAPYPGLKFAEISAISATLANPALGPERQQGWDAGFDAVFNGRGSLSMTYYHQTAENLIDYVLLQALPVLTYQYQNVGRVTNTGVEVEGTFTVRPVTLRAQYAYTRSRVDQLAASYAGNLQVADQTLGTPKHTAGGSFALTPFSGTTVTAGVTYVGSWNQLDYLGWVSCLGDTGPCRNSSFALNRDYIVAYPHLVKVTASVVQQFAPRVAAFVAFDNLTNNEGYEQTNLSTVMGRLTTVGLRLHY